MIPYCSKSNAAYFHKEPSKVVRPYVLLQITSLIRKMCVLRCWKRKLLRLETRISHHQEKFLWNKFFVWRFFLCSLTEGMFQYPLPGLLNIFKFYSEKLCTRKPISVVQIGKNKAGIHGRFAHIFRNKPRGPKAPAFPYLFEYLSAPPHPNIYPP